MASSLLVHNIVLFNRVRTGSSYLYVANNLNSCFYLKQLNVSDSQTGLNLSSIGTCLIPAFAMSEKTFVPPLEWQDADLSTILSQHLVTLNIDDIIAKGYCDKETMNAKDILSTYDAFTVRHVAVDDFSDNKCYLAKGL